MLRLELPLVAQPDQRRAVQIESGEPR
jgi:hypothetical protein